MARLSKAEKAFNAKVDNIASLATFNNPVSIMKLGELTNVVRKALKESADDTAALNAAKEYIKTLNGHYVE